MKTTIVRDFSILLARRGFWWLLALWLLASAIIYFAYLEDFLTIQPKLRAQNFRYGVTDIVIIPYLKTLGMVSMLFVVSLCSRLFYHEHFSAFSLLFRSTRASGLASASTLVTAKWCYVGMLSGLAVLASALPVLGSGFFFTFNGFRVGVTLVAIFVLLLAVGAVAMVLSQQLAHGILVMVATMALVIAPEIATRLLVEPAWVAPIVAFFSPIAHVNRIATGVVSVSDAVFFALLLSGLTWIAIRQFENTYLRLG